VSWGMAWTIRCDSLELWRDLLLHGMGEVDFHFFENIGNSLHHQIFQFGPRASRLVLGFCLKPGYHLRSYQKNKKKPKNDTNNKYLPGNWATSQKRHFFIKWLPFLCIFLGPMEPGTTWDPMGDLGHWIHEHMCACLKIHSYKVVKYMDVYEFRPTSKL
jgi:hypothetical protein